MAENTYTVEPGESDDNWLVMCNGKAWGGGFTEREAKLAADSLNLAVALDAAVGRAERAEAEAERLRAALKKEEWATEGGLDWLSKADKLGGSDHKFLVAAYKNRLTRIKAALKEAQADD